MPFKHELTWMPHAKRWRKRYMGQTHYMKTNVGGRKDRDGYLAALREWERLKAFIDGLGPNPYTETGALIPESQVMNAAPVYVPPYPATQVVATNGNGHAGNGKSRQPSAPMQSRSPDDPPFILSTGIGPFLHPEQVASENGNPYAGERRIEALAEFWLDHRHKQAERGELSLKQWAEDKAKLRVFRDFMRANFPHVVYVDEIDPAILNLYRDKQWEFVDSGDENSIGKATLKKRLDTVGKWLTWLVDQNILAELPKDLRTYGRVKLDKPKPLFWSVDEVKKLASNASERTRLYIMLALNLGYTQKDIATLEASMIDWETGIVTRDRHKTGVPSRAKLWPSTLALLQEHRSPTETGPVLLDQNGTPLYTEHVNDNGKLITNDAIRLAFNRLKHAKKTGFKGDSRSFKHLRKSAANEIEKSRPDLTELFLAHAEPGMKKHYVSAAYESLFAETDKLESLYGI